MIKLKKNVVIAALARDCEQPLSRNIPRIEELRGHFKWSHVIVVENDSKDNTKNILNNWKNKSDEITIISNDYGTVTIPPKSSSILSPSTSFYRIEKMCHYRNIYLSFLETLDKNIDYLIVIDIDIENFSVSGLVNSITEAPKDWGGIFSNGVSEKKIFGKISKLYFDIFAVYEYPLKDKFYYTEEILEKTFKTVNKNIRKNKFYSVVSAFSGIAIYRYNAIKDKRYVAIQNIGNKSDAICEHIPFNEELIKSGFKNYISRNFLVIYGTHNVGLIIKYILPKAIFNLCIKTINLWKHFVGSISKKI